MNATTITNGSRRRRSMNSASCVCTASNVDSRTLSPLRYSLPPTREYATTVTVAITMLRKPRMWLKSTPRRDDMTALRRRSSPGSSTEPFNATVGAEGR